MLRFSQKQTLINACSCRKNALSRQFVMSLRDRLIPVTGTELDRSALSHGIHNLVNVPWLVTVARGVVGRYALVVLVSDTLLHAIDNVVVVGVHVVLGIVAPDPLGELGGSETGVELDFLPVGVLEELCVAEAELLCARVTDETRVMLGMYHDKDVCVTYRTLT
jgi:hypothetical protein